jgi:hypothetical protein
MPPRMEEAAFQAPRFDRVTDTSEKGLENIIVTAMTGRPWPDAAKVSDGTGWLSGHPQDYAREWCVDLVHLTAFLNATQPRLAKVLDLAEDSPTRRQFLARLSSEVGKHIPDPALAVALQAMTEGRALGEQARYAYDSILADPMMAAAGRLVRARKTVGALAEVIVKKLDAARVKLTIDLHNTARDTARPVPSTSPASIAIERQVADVLRNMSEADRRKSIMAAIESDNETVLTSVFAGPALLVGLPDDQREAYRQLFRKKRWPDVVEREQRIKAALADVEKGWASDGGLG